jgi:hypothetical protein
VLACPTGSLPTSRSPRVWPDQRETPSGELSPSVADLLLYLEKHFSLLPTEICGRSLAFDLLRTMRLSLRCVAKYGKYDKDDQ